MRVKPWVVSAAAALVATASVAVVVTMTDPAEAKGEQFVLLWASLCAGVWATLVTIFLWARMNLAQAVWVGALWTVVAFGTFVAVRSGIDDPRLLGGILFVTLFLSFFVWRVFRHGRT